MIYDIIIIIIICSFISIVVVDLNGVWEVRGAESARHALFFFCVLIPRCKSFFDFELCKRNCNRSKRVPYPLLSFLFFSPLAATYFPPPPYLSPSNSHFLQQHHYHSFHFQLYPFSLTFMNQKILLLTRVHHFLILYTHRIDHTLSICTNKARSTYIKCICV